MFVVLGAIAGIVVLGIVIHNKLVSLRARWRNAYAQIDVQLKRRYDLIPNLVEGVQAYMQHERETLTAVIGARNAAFQSSRVVAQDPTNANAMLQLQALDAQLTSSLGRLLAVSENYPELASSETMHQFQEELSSSENKIAFARQAYNDAVMTYNTAIEQFPNSLLAGPRNFRPAVYFKIENRVEREAPKVNFMKKSS